jgi:hypothetical protein
MLQILPKLLIFALEPSVPELHVQTTAPESIAQTNLTSNIMRYPILTALLLLTLSATALASETIEERILKLEKELTELKALVKSATPTEAKTQAPQPEKKQQEAPLSVSLGSGARVQLYGFARLDASYDTGKIHPGNIALWALPEGLNNDDSEWNFTGNATRIGLNLSGPDTENLKLSGNIEFDFLSGLGAENNGSPRLRHGYLKAFWPSSDFSIIAGQTWDVHSSLIPFVDDPAIMWNAGNIGMRHPQLRMTKGFATDGGGRFEIAVAAARTIGEKNEWADSWNTDPGKDAEIPTIQGRIAYAVPLLVENRPALLAVSGHYGEEEWDTDKSGDHETAGSWSCNVELSMPLSEKLVLAGEYFTGTNLDDYAGGIGQGVRKTGTGASTYGVDEVASHGGWAALRYTYSPSTTFSLGGGIDDPDDGDLPAGARSLNRSIFAGMISRITPNFILGLQLSQWRTDYKDSEEGDALRAQSSLTYTF